MRRESFFVAARRRQGVECLLPGAGGKSLAFLGSDLTARTADIPTAVSPAGGASALFFAKARCADGVPEFRRTDETTSCSRFPRIEHGHSHTFEVGYISSRHGQPVHEGRGCDESVSIGARVRYVKRRASLGNGGVNR
jgi:hypothetical protein